MKAGRAQRLGGGSLEMHSAFSLPIANMDEENGSLLPPLPALLLPVSARPPSACSCYRMAGCPGHINAPTRPPSRQAQRRACRGARRARIYVG